MLPRHRDISYPNLALVATSHLYHLSRVDCADHVHRLVLFSLLLQAFEHDVWIVGSLQHKQFVTDIIALDDLWVRILADLALKLREVVGNGEIVLLDDHLGLDPSLEAVDMHN